MLIEAVDHPIRYRFPGGEIRLEPGQPVEVEPERAAKLLAKAGTKVRAVEVPSCDVVLETASPTIRVGDRIEWERADLTVQHGVVDVLHIDDAGTHWAFVTLGERWAVVNMKFAKGSTA